MKTCADVFALLMSGSQCADRCSKVTSSRTSYTRMIASALRTLSSSDSLSWGELSMIVTFASSKRFSGGNVTSLTTRGVSSELGNCGGGRRAAHPAAAPGAGWGRGRGPSATARPLAARSPPTAPPTAPRSPSARAALARQLAPRRHAAPGACGR